VPFTRLSCTTIIRLTITSSAHDDSLCRLTTRQPSCWSGYCHAPRNVETFSANHTKVPMSTKTSTTGNRRSVDTGVNATQLRPNTTSTAAIRTKRMSGSTAFVKKFR